MHYEDTYDESALWNRISIAALTLMAAAFMFAIISPVFASAYDSVDGVRDDGSGDLVANEEEEDGEDGDNGDDDISSGTGQPSIGSFSGNTATGTTAGTGVSQSVSDSSDESANTATGTTRGTGASHSVSNSS